MSDKEKPRYFYVPIVNQDKSYGGYATMDECARFHDSGQLVADHMVLDEIDDLRSALTQAQERIRELGVERKGFKHLLDNLRTYLGEAKWHHLVGEPIQRIDKSAQRKDGG